MNNNQSSRRIFISHATQNEAIAHKLVDLLVGGVGVPNNDIFCSSLKGNSINTGKAFIEKIKCALDEAKVVFLLLSPNYYESTFSLAEMGGAWSLGKEPYPVVVPPLRKSDVTAVLLGRQAIKIDDDQDLDVMLDDLKNDLGLVANPTPTWNRKKKEFIASISELAPKQPSPMKVDFQNYEKVSKELSEYKRSNADLESQIEKQKDTIKQLLLTNDSEERRKLVLANLSDHQRFTALVEEVNQAAKNLPNSVMQAFFYEEIEKNFWPDFKDPRIDDAEEQGFLEIDTMDKNITPRLHDPQVARLNNALISLRKFLNRDAKPEFFEHFVRENNFHAELENKRFWIKYLKFSTV